MTTARDLNPGIDFGAFRLGARKRARNAAAAPNAPAKKRPSQSADWGHRMTAAEMRCGKPLGEYCVSFAEQAGVVPDNEAEANAASDLRRKENDGHEEKHG